MQKRDLNSLYAWARSVASSSGARPVKRRRGEALDPLKDVVADSQVVATAETPAVEEEVDLTTDEDWSIPSDTATALKMLHMQFPLIEKVSIRPFVLLSQLYSSIKDHTHVDRELEVLKRKRIVRVFKLNTGQDDYAIMYLDDYIMQINQAKESLGEQCAENEIAVFDWFRDHVLPVHVDVGITQIHLESLLEESGNSIRESHISLLIKAGLMVRQLADQKSYWFTIPNIGFLLKNLSQGRRELLSLLNRCQYKQTPFSALEKKKLRMSQLGMRFHIRDLLGSGQLSLINTPSGLFVRISKM